MHILQLGEAINNYLITSNNVITIKILQLLKDNIFLVETDYGTLKAKISGEVSIGDVIKAKLLTKTPLPAFEKLSLINKEQKSIDSFVKMFQNFDIQSLKANVLQSLGKENIKNLVNEEKIKLLKLVEKQMGKGEKMEPFNLNHLDAMKINSKELYQLIFNRYIVVYFRAPEYDIKDGFLYIRKYRNRSIRCRLFLFFSNIGRVFVFISGLNEQYNIIVKSDMDLSFALKNIVIDNVTINWKKIDKKKYSEDDFFHSNYFSIKI